MGRIDESNSNLFFYTANGENNADADELPGFLTFSNHSEFTSSGANPDAYKGNIFFERGRYLRSFLFGGDNNAVGGANEVTANSSPQELLRNPRVRAMLDVIAYAEGTRGNGDYRRVVYGRVIGPADPNLPYDRSLVGRRNVLVSSLERHPNLLVQVNGSLRSTAAGRYQFLNSTWRGLNMPDFSERSQDLAAIKLMQRRGMIEPLLNGDFNTAIHRGAREWASLPTVGGESYYGQGAKNIRDLRQVFTNALERYQQNAPDLPPSNQPGVTTSKPPVSDRFTARAGTYGSRNGTDIDAIILHHTAGSNASGAYQAMQSRGLSAHYIVDKDGTIYQMVGDERRAFHAGGGSGEWRNANSRSIGIEIVNMGDGRDGYTEAQYRALEQLVPYLAQRYDISASNIVGHSQIGNPDRPASRPEPSSNFNWNRIRQSVTNGGETNPSPETNSPITPPNTNPTPDNSPGEINAPTAFLRRGRTGEQVRQLQDALVRLGYMTRAQVSTGYGIFGPRTENAVREFQGDYRDVNGRQLVADGIYGPLTQGALRNALERTATLRRGSQGERVQNLQDSLVRLGYMTRAEVNTGYGTFGPKTENAVREFQRDHRDVNGRQLVVDGIFGPLTRGAMRAALQRADNQPTNPTQQPPQQQNGENGGGSAPTYRRWNVYSTGDSPARLADGYEDLQAHHDYQTVNYVMRGLNLTRRLEARDIVLTRPGQSNFGQAVPSPLAGEVLFAGDEGDGYGNKVVVRSANGQLAMIGHLQSLNVQRGQTVAYGQNLGGQGSTGTSTGAHIHINADSSVIRRWVADLADGRFDGDRRRFDVR